jgi:hypothetical protein
MPSPCCSSCYQVLTEVQVSKLAQAVTSTSSVSHPPVSLSALHPAQNGVQPPRDLHTAALMQQPYPVLQSITSPPRLQRGAPPG